MSNSVYSNKSVMSQLDKEDIPLIIELACSLDTHPNKSNWVEKYHAIDEYLCTVAKAIMRSGKDISSAISIAVSRMHVWATGKGVSKEVQAKAAKSIANWERARAEADAKKVKLSYGDDYELTFNNLFGIIDISFSDSELLLAAQFEDCSTVGPLDRITLLRSQKQILELSTLTTKQRKNMDSSDFGDPENRAYPLKDPNHARNALSRVMQHGDEELRKKIIRAVHRKYPDIELSDEMKKYL